MINKNFKRDWKISKGGQINLVETDHFLIDIDRDFFGIDISFSPFFKIINIQILNVIIKFY